MRMDELKSLDLLTEDNDSMIFGNVQFQIANYVMHRMSLTDTSASSKLFAFFQKLRDYSFGPSKGHSFLLQVVIKYDKWTGMADFLDWWNFDNLTPDDFTPYVNQRGQKMMTLAERAYIAYSKALLKTGNTERIRRFLPKMDALMSQHPEMMYPGYFYGKLLLSLGSDKEEELRVIMPFARKKATEFWVWQLLGDVFVDDDDKQMACLLRAVHCRTQENFLGKVRMKLAELYINRRLLNCARYQIDMVTRCYVAQGWRLPPQIDGWIHQPWLNETVPDERDPIDYKSITDDILCSGAEDCIAVITHVDPNRRKAAMVYGYEKNAFLRLPIKVAVGMVLRLRYVKDKMGEMNVLKAERTSLPNFLQYAKCMEGVISKRDDKEFAFLKAGPVKCFVPPAIVAKYKLSDGGRVKGLMVCDYNKKKESWNWVCVYVQK